MEIKEFDEKFRELYTNMVEIAFEYVNNNKEEIEEIYVFASMEREIFFYQPFFKINGQLVKLHKINTVSKQQHDVSSERNFKLLKSGAQYLENVHELFKAGGGESPTLIKVFYSPGSGKLNNNISYDLHYTNDKKKTASSVFNEWFVEMGGVL